MAPSALHRAAFRLLASPSGALDLAAQQPSLTLYSSRDRAAMWMDAAAHADHLDNLTVLAVETIATAHPDGGWIASWLDEMILQGPTVSGTAQAIPDGDVWRPALDGERGKPVITLPVWGFADGGIQAVDLLALDPDRPDRWRSMTGLAEILGETALESAQGGRTAIRVYRHPLHWLAAGGRTSGGTCILNPGAVCRELSGAHEIIADDPEHMRELVRLTRPPRAPGVRFVSDILRRAA